MGDPSNTSVVLHSTQGDHEVPEDANKRTEENAGLDEERDVLRDGEEKGVLATHLATTMSMMSPNRYAHGAWYVNDMTYASFGMSYEP